MTRVQGEGLGVKSKPRDTLCKRHNREGRGCTQGKLCKTKEVEPGKYYLFYQTGSEIA